MVKAVLVPRAAMAARMSSTSMSVWTKGPETAGSDPSFWSKMWLQNGTEDIVDGRQAVVCIQAAWRGAYLRLTLPAIVGSLYSRILVNTIYSGLLPRTQAKAFIRARNRRIGLLRAEIRRHGGFTSFIYRQRLTEELEGHVTNQKHRLRAALILQAWWRGCRTRGWPGRRPMQHRRSRVRISHFSAPRQDSDDDERRKQSGQGNFLFFLPGQRLRHQFGGSSSSVSDPRSAPPHMPDVGCGQEALEAASEAWIGDLRRLLGDDGPMPGPMLGDAFSWLAAPFNSMTNRFFPDHDDQCYPNTAVKRIDVPRARTLGSPRKVVIYYSDTGGGHFASASALKAALARQYGDDIEVTLTDFIRTSTTWPWSNVPEAYQALGNYPSIYKTLFDMERSASSFRDTKIFSLMRYYNRAPVLAQLTGVVSSGVDLILSVHPLINHMIVEGLKDIFGDREITVRVVTVVTDLGSAHFSWFEPRVDALFVPSGEIKQLALDHLVPLEKIHLCGLPVREGFWHRSKETKPELQALLLGLRPGLRASRVVLLMGGGEGFGALVPVAVAIGERLLRLGLGQLVVVCGRNNEVREKLECHDWPKPSSRRSQHVEPLILGFVANIDEFMSAADILVTKAGPGSIAEAMIKGLPCLLTSLIPGQEEGNVTFVTEAGAGEFVADLEPERVADTVEAWLENPQLLNQMSANARRIAHPNASLDITRRLCQDFLDLPAPAPSDALPESEAGTCGGVGGRTQLNRGAS
mmetsp:Transcript_167011/g.531215  ORF Transcript_167011/g.531215 Transcript_167011/m.531215 type:complete len:748 (-) Transcript_167011:9-2252(-)